MTSPDTTRTAYGNEIREAPYVLIKRGFYWRPEAQGYTGVLAEAGRYTLDKVRPYLEDPAYEVKVQLASEADEFAPACWEETKFRVLKNEIAQLQAERDSLCIRLQEAERALKPFAALSFSYDGFSCDPAVLVFNGREHGPFWPNEHAAFEAMIKAAKLALLPQENGR